MALIALTLRVCRARRVTPAAFSRLLGSWIHILLFRRPLLVVLGAAFRVRPVGAAPFDLEPDVLNELLLLRLLAPAACTNLRADILTQIFAVDASPTGAGACSATVGPAVGRELYRHVESRGVYIRLASPSSALLLEFTGDLDVEELIGVGPIALGAQPPGPRSTSSWDSLLLGLGAGDVIREGVLGGMTSYDGQFAGVDGGVDDLCRNPFCRALAGIALRRAVGF